MLTQKDVKDIVINALGDFFENVLAPYLDREHKENQKEHEEIRAILKSHDKRFDTQDKDLDSIQRKLEKNEDDHEEIFDKLEDINQKVNGHEKRIKKLEVSSGLNN